MDGLTSQNVMPVDGEGLGIPGKALKKRWCLGLFLKAGRVEMDESRKMTWELIPNTRGNR